jgi:hypothetical protein
VRRCPHPDPRPHLHFPPRLRRRSGGGKGGGSSPVGVPPRSLTKGTLVAQGCQRQAMLPKTRPGRPALYARSNRGTEASRFSTGVTRAAPVLVQRSTSRAGHSAGRMMPKPPGERAVSSRPREPHSLRLREYPRPKASPVSEHALLPNRGQCRNYRLDTTKPKV